MLLPAHRAYVANALAGTPDVLDGLLQNLSPDSPIWDLRPDPDRFSLREVLAHLADWEPIHLDRLTRTVDENVPDLPQCDEGRIALDHDCAHQEPHGNLTRFRQGRAALAGFLRALHDVQWTREAEREGYGRCSIEAMAVVALAHDSYHVREVVQWLAVAREQA